LNSQTFPKADQPKLPKEIPGLDGLPPGRALDLACGSGRHSRWLAARGWEVTSVDLIPEWEGVVEADLERGDFVIAPEAWDLIVCWLYWQENLMPAIARGVRPGGTVALAGKTTGRFATSLDRYRSVFGAWTELVSCQNEAFVFLICRKEVVD
jgi:SAM-dependent methyltransferase